MVVGHELAAGEAVKHWQCPACPVRLAAPGLGALGQAAARHWQAWHGDELPAELADWL